MSVTSRSFQVAESCFGLLENEPLHAPTPDEGMASDMLLSRHLARLEAECKRSDQQTLLRKADELCCEVADVQAAARTPTARGLRCNGPMAVAGARHGASRVRGG